ncbi:general substrate transporter [Anaeromyces robustus]|uniref:General substrate transporter n=1 Tax=Anaeromyces robustus TaxID=1754192 RepID=A0A1Y1XD30_9FUNG|nr:general substrate transporter [Anaeromyces robustus]|eukprot:ORX83658.1 general substrate transporter [Anaeromyces robustus]
MVRKSDYVTKRLLFSVIIASVASLIYGWEVGMLNILFSMRGSFGNVFGLYEFDRQKKTFVETESKPLREMIITPSFIIGGIFGSIIVLYLMDTIGRIRCLRIGSIIYFIGGLIQVLCKTIAVLCIGRFISGIASGITLCICPLFISEIAPKQIRGTLGIVNSLGLQGGMFLASLCNTLCLKFITKNMNLQWRTAVGCQMIPSLFFLIFVWFLRETPRYLLLKRDDEKALDNLAYIRQRPTTDPEVADEFNEMNGKLKVELSEGMASWKEIFTTKSIIYRVVIVSVLQLLHMLVGINAIGYYSTQIYSKYLNISPQKYGAWLATLNNVISFICTVPAMRYIENFGRKPLLKWGAFGLGCCMVAICVLCHLCEVTHKSVFAWICVIVIYLFGIIYSWSWSSAVFVFQSELFPLRMRAKANTIGGIFQYIGSMIVGATTTTLMKFFGYYTFLIYAGFCLIAFIFTSLCVRETKGIALEDMDRLYGGDIEARNEFKRDINNCFETNVKEV